MPNPIDPDNEELIARLNRFAAIKKRKAAINVEIAGKQSRSEDITALQTEITQLNDEAVYLRDGNGAEIRPILDLLNDGIF